MNTERTPQPGTRMDPTQVRLLIPGSQVSFNGTDYMVAKSLDSLNGIQIWETITLWDGSGVPTLRQVTRWVPTYAIRIPFNN
jgi:hypothetical protein